MTTALVAALLLQFGSPQPVALTEKVMELALLRPEPARAAGADFARLPVFRVGELTGVNLPDRTASSRKAAQLRTARLPLGAIASSGLAGDAAASSAPAPAAFKPVLRAESDRGAQRKWLLLTIAQHSAAAFDAWTTRRVVGNGLGYERNPLLRPFAKSGALYAAIHVGPLVNDWLARRLQRSQIAWVRKLWWLPQTVGAALHVWGGIHNLGVARAAR